MKKEILKRLDALESPRHKNRRAAERKVFFEAALTIMLAYYLGGLKPTECYLEGYARALGFENSDGYYQAVGQVLNTLNDVELKSRHNDAVRRLFSDDDRSSPEALEEATIEMAKRLPDQWRAWITKEVEKVDYEKKQTQSDEWEERELARLEFFAAAEARARSRNGESA